MSTPDLFPAELAAARLAARPSAPSQAEPDDELRGADYYNFDDSERYGEPEQCERDPVAARVFFDYANQR